MAHPNFVILYVENPTASRAFYAALLGNEPIQASPTFVMFALSSGVMLGLWQRGGVEPAALLTGGGAELAIATSPAEVDSLYAEWKNRGLPILQDPTAMDFGYTFTTADPDGHRIRVFAPAPE